MVCHKFIEHICAIGPLTLNVPDDCGSSRPTRVEPRLHRVGIEWQVRGRCVGSAAHPPLHAIAARPSISRASVHLASPVPTTYPAHFAWALTLCVCPGTLRGPAPFAWARTLCNPRAWRAMHWYPFPCNFQPIQFAIQANHVQYYLTPMPFSTQGRKQNSLHNQLIMLQIRQSSNRTDRFLTSRHFKTLRNIEICT